MLCPRTLLHVKKRYGDSCHASWMEIILRSWLFCTFKPLIPQADWRLTSTLQYHPWITREGHKITRNDHYLKKLLIVKQILLVNTIGNIYGTLCGICILMLRWKRLTKIKTAMWSTRASIRETVCRRSMGIFSSKISSQWHFPLGLQYLNSNKLFWPFPHRPISRLLGTQKTKQNKKKRRTR